MAQPLPQRPSAPILAPKLLNVRFINKLSQNLYYNQSRKTQLSSTNTHPLHFLLALVSIPNNISKPSLNAKE